jgi:hypothetical protein
VGAELLRRGITGHSYIYPGAGLSSPAENTQATRAFATGWHGCTAVGPTAVTIAAPRSPRAIAWRAILGSDLESAGVAPQIDGKNGCFVYDSLYHPMSFTGV